MKVLRGSHHQGGDIGAQLHIRHCRRPQAGRRPQHPRAAATWFVNGAKMVKNAGFLIKLGFKTPRAAGLLHALHPLEPGHRPRAKQGP